MYHIQFTFRMDYRAKTGNNAYVVNGDQGNLHFKVDSHCKINRNILSTVINQIFYLHKFMLCFSILSSYCFKNNNI